MIAVSFDLFAWAGLGGLMDDDDGNPLPRRSDGRRHDTGMVRPYRPCPADFREVFLRFGQSREIEEHYRTNYRVIRRWIEESGGEELRAERYKITGSTARPKLRSQSPASKYVMGLRRNRP